MVNPILAVCMSVPNKVMHPFNLSMYRWLLRSLSELICRNGKKLIVSSLERVAWIYTKSAPVPALLGYGVQFPMRLELFGTRYRLCLPDKRWTDLRSSDSHISEKKDELALASQQPPVSQCGSNHLELVPRAYASPLLPCLAHIKLKAKLTN